ncbi:MAG: dTDP-4-dehydrorhamnose reductase [Candidatus Lambdaproteobacteria bacterium]|nr:dTDP-4-dehydrorhamnose reductase [Candidatus Lambdaproteobacteria bacterium]
MAAPTPDTALPHWKILVIGANGQVGWELLRALQTHAILGVTVRSAGQAPAGLPWDALELSDTRALREIVRRLRPNLIVNAAAYTAVDRAETEEALALAVNAEAPAVMAEEARRLGASLLHYSTDYVYDGEKADPYLEDDPPRPLSAYGRSKLAGDRAIEASGVPHLILRTSWVYGLRSRNFVRAILTASREKPELRVVADQWGAATWCRTIAQATAHILAHRLGASPLHAPDLAAVTGTYHLCASGADSRFGVAQAIVRLGGGGSAGTPCRLTPVTTAEYPMPAVRPRNSRLSLAKLERTFGIRMPSWETALVQCLAKERQGA